jgi:4-amino-4-deoxychorismate lyase
MLAALLNGQSESIGLGVGVEDRGLAYGDGLFETMRWANGRIRLFARHYARLQRGCEELGIPTPSVSLIQQEIDSLARPVEHACIKYIVTRGAGGRGYRGSATVQPNRLAMLYPPTEGANDGIRVRWCATRLARNAQLAGIKHLNRLENVLAQREWDDARIAEGLLMDTEGELIGATAGNLFVVIDGVLVTPDLRFSGIRGVMREHVLSQAKRLGIATEERALWPDELVNASEAFITNALRGVRPIIELDGAALPDGSVALRIQQAVAAADE